MVKEKWDEVNRLRKRRVRWTIGGDRIEIDYEVGTNTAALTTVNALFHSIVSTHRCRGRIQVGCRWLGMWPTRTPMDRDGTAWQGHSWAWRGSCRVRVRWGE